MSKPWLLEDGYKFEGENDKDLDEFIETYSYELVEDILTILTDETSKFLSGSRYGIKVIFGSSENYYPDSVENPGMVYNGEVKCADCNYSVTITSDNSNGTQIVEWFKE